MKLALKEKTVINTKPAKSQIVVRLTEDLLERVDLVAQKHGISRNAVLVSIIEQSTAQLLED